MTIQPFSANVPQEVLDDLKSRLQHVRWPDEVAGSGWTYGSNLSYMKELSNYWLNNFDWRRIENEINQYPNFKAEIDGHQIHFLHIKGKGKTSVPLIITHGWPGSYVEMLKLIPLLTNDPEFSFDLVIPSIPGFGYSEKIAREGVDSAYVAGLWHQLMHGLGYEKYAAQGGDIGSGVSSWMALQHPERMIGIHLNYIPGSYKPYIPEGETLSDEIKDFQKLAGVWMAKEGAYAQIHATKPITVAYGLNDSPIGLAAWIIEKFNSWSDNRGNIENVFSKDELLANITLYWITETISSSVRMYNANSKRSFALAKDEFVRVPLAVAKFPKELPTPPRSYITKGFNLQQWTEMPAGGHFAAMEQPELLAKDITKFFRSLSVPVK